MTAKCLGCSSSDKDLPEAERSPKMWLDSRDCETKMVGSTVPLLCQALGQGSHGTQRSGILAVGSLCLAHRVDGFLIKDITLVLIGDIPTPWQLRYDVSKPVRRCWPGAWGMQG